MATTTNFGFEIPDDTDLVKDGALAMRTLGQDVDTQLFTALGGDYPGLRLIKKQTIGSAVASVTVTDAFSATYDAYKIILSGGAGSAEQILNLKIGAAATGYYGSILYANYNSATPVAAVVSNGANFTYIGNGSGSGLSVNVDVNAPFLTKLTVVSNGMSRVSSFYAGQFNGFLNNSTSYTDFTITPNTGTMTGGTIYVYGYGAS
jgi:hypothetical protein